MKDHHDYAWVEGERVRIVLPVECVWPSDGDAGEDVAGPRGGGWWPSDSVRRVALEELSRREALEVSDWARKELIYWLAGDGLHPLRWLRRWTMALWRYAPGSVPLAGALVYGSAEEYERAGMSALFPRGDGAKERGRLEAVWGGLGDRCQVRGVRTGRLDDLEAGDRALEGCEWVGPEADRSAAEAEASAVARLALGNFVLWLAGDGGWCLGALKRFYVAIFVEYQDLAPRMTGEDWGAIYGQTRAAFCEDAKRYVGRPLEAEFGYRPKVAGQKRADAAEAYAENARKHCPRRQVGPVNQAEESRALSREDEARLRAIREDAEKRQREKDAEEMRVRAERNRGRVVRRNLNLKIENT